MSSHYDRIGGLGGGCREKGREVSRSDSDILIRRLLLVVCILLGVVGVVGRIVGGAVEILWRRFGSGIGSNPYADGNGVRM